MPRQTHTCRFWTVLSLLLIVAGLMGSSLRPARADGPDVTVRLSPEQAAQFHSSLVALEAQGHITVVAEGAPMTPTLVGKVVEGVPLTQAQIRMVPQDLTLPLPLDEAVARVAKAYDYSVERHPGLFMLRKCYTDPADLPGVTLEECTLALQDIHTLLSAFAPDPKYKTPAILAADIISTFSLEQQAAMQRKDASAIDNFVAKGPAPVLPPQVPLPTMDIPPAFRVTVTDLDPQQRTVVWQMVTFGYVKIALDSADRALSILKQSPQTSIGVRTVDYGDPAPYTLFGFQAPNSDSTTRFFPFWEELGSSASAIQSRLAHPTKFQEDAIQAREDAAKEDGHVTLVQEADVLGGRGLHVAVDPALCAKPIMVVGAGDIAPAQVVQAMADVYGLRTFVKDDGTMVLTRWPLRIPDDITDLPEQVRRLIPDPLQRIIHMKDEAALMDRLRNSGSYLPVSKVPASGVARSGQPSPPKAAASEDTGYWPVGQPTPSGDREDDDHALNRFISMFLPDRIKQPALERLRAAIDRGPTPAHDESLVLLSSLTDAGRTAFAVSFLTDFLHSASEKFNHPPPYYITHFDSYSMKVVIYPEPGGTGKTMVAISLLSPDQDGSGVHLGPGIVAPYTPEH